MKAQLLQQASVLDIDEQIELAEAIWTGIVSRGLVPSLTQAQKLELDRRLADNRIGHGRAAGAACRARELNCVASQSGRSDATGRCHPNQR